MVICTYFLTNNCRFGSKCNNDHIDLASVIKSEVDVTLKGNQWPLSCFGPFKERNCVPNFIEDFCFEEIRMMHLEAKMQNNIPTHQMQLAQMINEAKQKMQWLSTTNRDIMNILIEIYNQQEDSSKLPATQVPGGNAFGAAPMGTTAPANMFVGAGSGAFATASSNFSGTSAVPNIFGAAPNQSAANIFGGGTSNNTLGGNIFAKPAQPATAQASNVFAISALGQQTQTNSVFGAPPVFGGTGASLFATAAQAQVPQAGGSIFASAPSNVPTGNLFAQQTQSVFTQSAQNQNLFANAAQAQPAVSPFTAAPAPAGSNLFAKPAFGTQQVAPQPQQNLFTSAFGSQQQQQASPFGQPVQQQPSQSLFLPAPQIAAPAAVTAVQSPFGGTQSSLFQQQPQQMPSQGSFGGPTGPTLSATLYSRMEDLTKEQLSAFNAERFELGKIPTVPPPRELCS